MSFMFIIPFLFLGFCIYKIISSESNSSDVVKLKHGIASKIEFEGHTYVVWQQNMSDCIVHDPNCECFKNKEK